MRGVSQFIAMLIVVAVVVGGAIVGAYIVSNVLSKQNPKGGDIVGKLVWFWQKTDDGKYVIYVHGPISNVGDEVVNITGVEICFNGESYRAKFDGFELDPSDWNDLVAFATVNELPKVSTISVVIRYCSESGCSASVVPAEIENTNYLIEQKIVTVTIPMVMTRTATVTVTVPGGVVTQTVTRTITTTVTSGASTVTRTTTITETRTVTTTTTATKTTTVTTTTTVLRKEVVSLSIEKKQSVYSYKLEITSTISNFDPNSEYKLEYVLTTTYGKVYTTTKKYEYDQTSGVLKVKMEVGYVPTVTKSIELKVYRGSDVIAVFQLVP